MQDQELLSKRFEENRPHLRAVAMRMLGSADEAEDAVQESWFRLSRSGADGVQNLGGWLTTVVSRVCLDMLRSRTSRREEPLERTDAKDEALESDPENETILADSLGPALLVVLDSLAPPERVAFVLHDLFGVPFDEIAPIVGRTSEATRQLASRARRRVRGAGTESRARDVGQREIVEAFLAASRGGDFDRLIALLDPNVVLRADRTTVRSGAEEEVRGADAVARTFAGRARAAQLALLRGKPGLVWKQSGEPRVAFAFRFSGDAIVGIDLIGDPDALRDLAIEPLV